MILTVEQARAAGVSSTLDDTALLRLLDAAEEAIIAACGPLSSNQNVLAVEAHRIAYGGRLVMLAKRAQSIETVTEGWLHATTVVDPGDYQLRPSGSILERLPVGRCWSRMVTVTYQPYTDVSSRARAQVELVKLEIAYTPGIASQSIGPWSESYGSSKPYADQKADILSSIQPPLMGIW